jgi:hypothetical protein
MPLPDPITHDLRTNVSMVLTRKVGSSATIVLSNSQDVVQSVRKIGASASSF